MRSGRSAIASKVAMASAVPEPRHELVEAQLLEAAPDRVELARADLHEPSALAHEVERLPQAGLAGVEAPDDRLEARGGRLVGLGLCRLFGHSSSSGRVASTAPSAKKSRTSPASRAAAALVMTLPARSSTTA